MKVIFAGTPEFAGVALDALLGAGIDVPLVLTQPDRPAGRGMKLQASPVKQRALDRGIAVAQPRSLKLDGKYPDDAAAAQKAMADAGADLMVVAAYGLILPQWVLDAPRLGCLNIHGSLLPRWRGAAPIHRAIEAGDAATGITIMQMDAGLDTGDMLLMERVAIGADDTTASLHDTLAALGGRMIVDAVRLAAQGALQRTPQPADGVTYAAKIDKAESQIDWSQPAVQIERKVRAMNPFPVMVFRLGGEAVKVWRTVAGKAGAGAAAAAGTVLAADARGVQVQCGEGVLTLLDLQRAGGKRLPAADFLRGFTLPAGTRLGE